FFVMVIGSLASTTDSDLAAMSSIVMTDIYGRNIAKSGAADPRVLLLVGRVTMITATLAALFFASSKFNILELLVLVGAIWGALVFPVIASFYWDKVTNRAFSISVIAALAAFFPVRFGWIALEGATAVVTDLLAVVGVGVIAGLMIFGFLGRNAGVVAGGIAALAVVPFGVGFLHQYPVLTASLLAYAVSMILCVALSWAGRERFDFVRISAETGNFDDATPTI
ncbi:MAG: sodium:proline symporter, partial [Roseibium sp.]